MAGTNYYTPITDNVSVCLTEGLEVINGVQLAMVAKCIGAPSVVALQVNQYEHGCIMNQIDSGTGISALFENTGSRAVPSWTAVATGPGGGITSINGAVGPAIVLAGGNDITVTESPANTFTIDSTAQPGIQWKDEAIPLGTSGTVTSVNFAGAGVTATRLLNEITVTIPTGSGGLSEFGYFFQTVAAVAGTIAANNGKALWSTANSNNTAGFTMVPATGDITVLTAGIYEVDWSLSAAEPGAMVPYVNGVKEDLAGGTYGSGAGTQQNTGKCLLILAANDIVSLRTDNCAAALTLQLAGTTNTNQVVASIMLKKVN